MCVCVGWLDVGRSDTLSMGPYEPIQGHGVLAGYLGGVLTGGFCCASRFGCSVCSVAAPWGVDTKWGVGEVSESGTRPFRAARWPWLWSLTIGRNFFVRDKVLVAWFALCGCVLFLPVVIGYMEQGDSPECYAQIFR